MTQISAEVGVTRSTCYRYIRRELGVRAYRIQIHQGLHFEDYDLRVESSEKLLPYLQNPKLKDLIFFSDEVIFHISGRVHKQNCRIWSTDPHESKSNGIKARKLMFGVPCHRTASLDPTFSKKMLIVKII